MYSIHLSFSTTLKMNKKYDNVLIRYMPMKLLCMLFFHINRTVNFFKINLLKICKIKSNLKKGKDIY